MSWCPDWHTLMGHGMSYTPHESLRIELVKLGPSQLGRVADYSTTHLVVEMVR